METEKPLVDKNYLLQKFEGKGGWTYAEIPEIPMPKTSFGMLKVKGKIDNYELSHVCLMPFGNGNLFFAIKAEIRKKIKKQASDWVRITLYPDNEVPEVPNELLLCLQDDPEACLFFHSLNKNEQYHYIKWIYATKSDQTKVERIAQTLVRLSKHQRFTDR